MFLRTEDFSDEKRRREEIDMAQFQHERTKARERQDASVRRVSDELEYALTQLGIELSDRDREFLGGVKNRALNFEQFMAANTTFNAKTPTLSLTDRIRRATVSSNEAERQWAIHADAMIGALQDLTARGSKIESVVLPARPHEEPRRAATGTQTGTQGAVDIAAK
jgi:hypothetical protein